MAVTQHVSHISSPLFHHCPTASATSLSHVTIIINPCLLETQQCIPPVHGPEQPRGAAAAGAHALHGAPPARPAPFCTHCPTLLSTSHRAHTHKHTQILPLAKSQAFAALSHTKPFLITLLTDARANLSPCATHGHPLIFPLFCTHTHFFTQRLILLSVMHLRILLLTPPPH